jgi:glycosyltransferase involved in cell wall biosynthesis
VWNCGTVKGSMPECVVQVVTQMEAGGAQRVALLLHRELRARGLKAELWFLYARTAMWADEPGVCAIWPQRPTMMQIPKLLAALVRKLCASRPDVVIAHTHYANVLSLAVARLRGVRSRIAVHHNAIGTYPWIARTLEPLWKRFGMYTASIAVSEDVKRSLLERDAKQYARATFCVYNGIDGEAGLRNASRSCVEDAEEQEFLRGKKILFNVGRLAKQKNQIALIEALPELPECVAVIAGRGPMEPVLIERARELGVATQVVLLGETSSETVASWMLRADVFVFPSLFEAMPMAMLEAMRAGLTIVASDIAAHREVAGDAAILTETDTPSLVRAIRVALAQDTDRSSLGEAARTRSLQFTVQAMADGYMGVL